MKKKGFTLIELLVVIAIIAMLLAILMPALSKVKKIAMRVVCGTNLKGLGTAQMVYANDYEDDFVLQGQGYAHTWLGYTRHWDDPDSTPMDWAVVRPYSIGASLYLLVREADVSPKSFVCPASGQTEYDGKNDWGHDLVELYDFGHPNYESTGPENCVSYSYHMPYDENGPSRYAADGTRSAAFAVMADKNPWQDPKLKPPPVTEETWMEQVSRMAPYYEKTVEKWEINRANSQPHDRDGQNVSFADGHSSYEKTPDVGVRHDNIYTIYEAFPPADEGDIRQGLTAANTYIFDNIANIQPLTSDDTILLNDDRID